MPDATWGALEDERCLHGQGCVASRSCNVPTCTLAQTVFHLRSIKPFLSRVSAALT